MGSWRLVPFSVGVFVLGGLGCDALQQGGGGGGGAAAGDAGTTSAAIVPSGGTVGGACGAEATTGQELCAATSACPNVVVDTAASPSCGFRIRSGVADLVCVCGSSLCAMGLWGTCDEAAKLLATQTQANVCAQVPEGRCSAVTATPPASTAGAPAASTAPPAGTTPPPSNPGNPACDRQCMTDCGGGSACASVCNCSS